MFDTLKLEVLGYFIIRNVGLVFKSLASFPNYRKRIFNPDKNFILLHGYAPKLTIYENLYKGDWVVNKFEIEGSVRKLVHGTSYYGVSEVHVDAIIAAFIRTLASYGIDCTLEQIEQGNVQIVAYSFNFYLPPRFAQPQELILPLVHLDVGKRAGDMIEKLWLQVTPGYGVKWYNKQRGIGLYDKGVEIENNQMPTKKDLEIVPLIKAGKLPHCFEIENTLQNRQAVKKGIAIFYDKDEKKERHIREVLKDKIAMTYLKNTFNRLADERNSKALEQVIYPLERYYKQMAASGISFRDAQLYLAHCIGVQQIGSLRLKQIGDSFPKHGRQYRQQYFDSIGRIVPKITGTRLSDFFAFCKDQLTGGIPTSEELMGWIEESLLSTHIAQHIPT